ncbi:MAG: hypothetical protein KAT06_10445 [Gammaproteobacteria bacterium]|nr:hypothetical protein [Gammaproteobacteria bacterium]
MSEVINKPVPLSEPLSDQGSILTDAYSKLDPVLGFFSDYPFAIFIVVVSISLLLAKVATKYPDHINCTTYPQNKNTLG